VLAEHAAVDDFALDFFTGDLEDAELDEAVGEKNARAGLEVFGESGKVVAITVEEPRMSRGVMVRRWPALS